MTRTASLIVVGAAVALIAIAGVVSYRPTTRTPQADVGAVELATPVGITVQTLGEARGSQLFGAGGAANVLRGAAYADAKGMTLYIYDKDIDAGKSACIDDCAKAWPPATAPQNAKPVTDWSVIGRDDGSKQWAYRGKPLYSFAKDGKVGDATGNGAADGVWHVALMQPSAGVQLPDGIVVQDVDDAGGQALADGNGMTLYVRDGKAADHGSDSSSSHWLPFAAAQLANATGDFSLVRGDDGTAQWAFKGRALFTFDGDLEAGNANGVGVDPRFQVAMVKRYYIPNDVAVHRAPGHGPVMTTAAGMTLYRRSNYIFQSTSGHGFRHGVSPFPSIGRAIGTKGCDSECLKNWHPLAAPADAQPSGFWEVATREDGTRQWMYKGYALYTYSGDKKPGDATGHEIYDYLIHDGTHKAGDPAIPMGGASAFYWAVTYP